MILPRGYPTDAYRSALLVSYGLVDRKCGVPLPGNNDLCHKARLRMCLQIPGLRYGIFAATAHAFECAHSRCFRAHVTVAIVLV
eukprot:COSAG02_NODE_5056_length_4688_cov_7.982559_2_plen_84_part_00